MEKVLEVCNNIKDRLSNPFVFSFICSWLVYNWRIPVALFWFDEKQISANGCSSIFEFIEDDWKRNGSIGWPLVFAFVYSFGIPYVKNFFRIVSARAQKWGENGEIKALDGGKIGMDKYLSLREVYLEKIKNLEQIISNESKNFLELVNKSKRVIELEDKINKINDVTFLNGKWEVQIRLNKPNDEKPIDGVSVRKVKQEDKDYTIDISSGTITYFEKGIQEPIARDLYKISDFAFVDLNDNKRIYMKMIIMNNQKLFLSGNNFDDELISFLKVSMKDGLHILTGTQNNKFIKYTKIV